MLNEAAIPDFSDSSSDFLSVQVNIVLITLSGLTDQKTGSIQNGMVALSINRANGTAVFNTVVNCIAIIINPCSMQHSISKVTER